MDQPPPPPPPHNAGARSTGLPPGNYDIFIVPPHSSGSGFLYLPSLQPQRNSFIAGCACTLATVGVWQAIIPQLRAWMSTVASSGGMGVIICILGVAVLGWTLGKSQTERSRSSSNDSQSTGHSDDKSKWSSPPPNDKSSTRKSAPPPNTSWQKPADATPGPSQWEKAREEMRRKKEEAAATASKAANTSKAEAEKARWEQARAREREAREKDAREKVAADRAKRENDKADEKPPKATGSATSATGPRPFDSSKRPNPPPSMSSYTESEYTSATGSTFSTSSSYSTTPTEPPPPRQSGPYSTKDPDKVVIKGVYAFTDHFAKPVAELVRGAKNVTDGLVLRMTTEGLFIDDDVRGVPQREWDVKAWSIKTIEVCTFEAAKTPEPPSSLERG